MIKTSDLSHFWSKVSPFYECMLWTGGMRGRGYGRFMTCINGIKKDYPAHRWIYEAVYGIIPDGYVIHHTCEIKRCVNPAHLKAVTQRENILQGNSLTAINARKASCPKGHKYNKVNTYISQSGSRMCRRCGAERMRVHNMATGGVYGTPKTAQPGIANSGASGDKKQVGGGAQPGIQSGGDTKTVK